MNKIVKLITAIVGCELVGILATPFTLGSIPGWYQTLEKPFFSPPNFIFGPVWTTLYFLMGVSAYLVWEKGLHKKIVKNSLIYFLIQLGFNFLWSLIFFGLHLPLLAFLDIIILWILIFITIKKFAKLSKVASYLLIPYLLWVTFAALLNLSIVFLNF